MVVLPSEGKWVRRVGGKGSAKRVGRGLGWPWVMKAWPWEVRGKGEVAVSAVTQPSRPAESHVHLRKFRGPGIKVI